MPLFKRSIWWCFTCFGYYAWDGLESWGIRFPVAHQSTMQSECWPNRWISWEHFGNKLQLHIFPLVPMHLFERWKLMILSGFARLDDYPFGASIYHSVPVNFMNWVPVNFAECVTTKLGYFFGDLRGKLQLMIFSLPPSLPKKKKMYVFCSFLEICINFIFLNVSFFSFSNCFLVLDLKTYADMCTGLSMNMVSIYPCGPTYALYKPSQSPSSHEYALTQYHSSGVTYIHHWIDKYVNPWF